MPRYELGSKFWDIALKGKSYTTTFGKIGSAGQTRLKTFASPSSARADHDQAIEKKRKEGYRLAEDIALAKAPVQPARGGDARLEQAIDADPYDESAYSVYADHLQSVGDIRGELIALQLANKKAAAGKLLEKHADYFLGPIAQHAKLYDHTYDRTGRRTKQIRPDAFTWKYGFIHALHLSHNQYAVDASDPKYTLDGSLAEVLEAVLAHPSGRFLAEIRFTFNNDPSSSLQDLIDVLAKKPRPAIRKLHFGDYKFAGGHHADMYGTDTEISWYSVGNLGKLWKKVPGLRYLITQGGAAGHALGGGIQLGTIDLPNLVHAELRTGGLEKVNARAIAKAKLPAIEHLDIWYGDPAYGGNATIEDVEILLARVDLPMLRHLGLMNAQFADALPDAIARSPLLDRLTVLDLSLGTMTDAGAQRLVAHKSAFAHLDVLDVSANYLSPAALKSLKGCAKRIVSRHQREDPAANEDEGEDFRHPAICE